MQGDFQLLDALRWGQVHDGGGTGGKGAGGLKSYEMAGVAPAPGQDRGPALDAVASLGLFVTPLAAADFAHHGQLKEQTVVALTTPLARLGRVLHDSFRENVNTWPDGTGRIVRAAVVGFWRLFHDKGKIPPCSV